MLPSSIQYGPTALLRIAPVDSSAPEPNRVIPAHRHTHTRWPAERITAPMTAQIPSSAQIPWAKNSAADSNPAGGIRFENITKNYPSRTGEPITVLQDLNLHIPAGQITVFVGPSGCGKTTSLRMINRMVEPNSGTITIDGVNVHEKNPYELRRGIGYVMQQGGLMPHRTVAQNIATVPRLLGASRKEAQARACLDKNQTCLSDM